MNDQLPVYAGLTQMLTDALELADQLGLEFVAIRIAEALDRLEAETPEQQ